MPGFLRQPDRDHPKALFFICIGVLIMAVAGVIAVSTCVFLHGALAADGIVTHDQFGNGTHISIGYTVGTGEQRSFSQNGFILGHYQGERVRVLYRPDRDGYDPCLDSFGTIWGLPLVLFAMGLAFFLAGRAGRRLAESG